MNLSANIKKKLHHNYHELTDLEKLYYRLVIRPTLATEHRFFFEGAPDIIGQMKCNKCPDFFHEERSIMAAKIT